MNCNNEKLFTFVLDLSFYIFHKKILNFTHVNSGILIFAESNLRRIFTGSWIYLFVVEKINTMFYNFLMLKTCVLEGGVS